MANEILSGEYRSAFKGKGLNFDKIREYQLGDDIRNIDWKVTARMQDTFVREYKEERQMSIMLLVDLSASAGFGTQKQSKRELIVEMASVLASLAIKNNDKVGMLLMTDHVEAYVAPKQGKAHVFKLIKDLLSFEPSSKKTNLKDSFAEAVKLIPQHSVVFILSDFLASSSLESFEDTYNYQRELKLLKGKHDVIAVSVRDPREFNLPNIGFMELINPESGQKQLLNLNRKSVRTAFKASQLKHFSFITKEFKRLGVDFLDLRTDRSYIQDLLSFFLRRERRSI